MPYAWYTKYANDRELKMADELGVSNRVDSYRDCLAADGSIKLGNIEI